MSIGGNRTITLNGNNNNTLAFGGTTSNTTSTAITTTVNNAAGVSGETLSFAGFNLVTGGSGGISDTFNGSGNIAITGVVANGTGSNGIIYSGTGTLTLSGANTYTGPTGINGGIVNLGVAQTGTTSGPLGAGASTQAVTFGGGTLQFSSVNNTDYSARIAAGTSTGAVSIDVNGQTVTFGTALTSTKSGGFTLADSGSGGTLTFSAANSYTGPTTIKSGTLKITGAGLLGATSNALVMNGGGLDLGGTAQSVGNLNGTGAIYNNSGSGNSVLTIGNGDNGGGNFQGVIENYATTSGGTVGVTKTGSASITLSGTNTYTGATIVNGGTLGLTGSLSGSSVSTSGTGVFSESSGAAIGGASSTFTQGSSGTSTLAGTNTYGGATFVSAGILKVQSSGALNASSTAATTISNGATLQIDGRGLSLANKIFIAGAGVSSVGGVYNTTGSNTLSGSIFATNNSATIAAAASTTLTLSGTITAGLNDNRTDHVLTFNTPTGGTINVTGHLQDNGASSGGGVVVNGGLVTFSNDNYNLTENTTLNAGELDLNASAPTVGATGYGNVFVNGGTLKLLANDQINAGASLAVTSGTVSFNGYNQTLLNLTNSGGTINYGSGTVVIIDPTWSGGTNTVVGSTSFGSLDISGGANTINSSGVLSVGGDSAGSGLTFSGTGAPSIIVNSGGKLVLTAGDVTGISTGANDSVNPAIAGLSGTGAALIGGSGQVDLGGGTQTINVASGGTSLEIDPQITNGAINETGAGKLILTGANNYTGGTTIGGTVQVGNGGATGNLGSGDVTNNGSLIYKRTGSLTESNAISGTGSVIQSGPGVVVLANSTGNTYAGGTSVTGGKLYVNNASGSGTGSGAVAISGGTVAGSGNITTSGGISVTAGGTLSSGDIQSGTTVDGTHLSVTDTNVLIASANLTFDLGAGNTVGSGFHTFGTPNLNTTYLSLAGTSTISFSGTDSVSLVDLTGGALSLRQGKPFLLVDGTSNSQYSGLVTSLDGRLDDLTLNGNGFVVGVGTLSSYTTIAVNQFGPDGVTPLTGNNAYYAPVLYLYNGDLEVVPEPGTWALMIGGLALLIVIQRRRNARN